jgi:alkylhydroperoxidase family enzyme
VTADQSARERVALEFARRVSRASPPVTPTDLRPLLEAGWDEDGIREICFVVAANVFHNRISTLPALPPETMEFASRWYVRFLRPLLARRLRPRRQRPAPGRLSADQCAGPFAAFVSALDGLPVASRLREVIDVAWRSEVLGRRAKALVLAVVSRGLGSRTAEAEATRLLDAEGMSRPEIDDVLANLAAPALDPVEAALVPFARETTSYRPAQIQRRARALRERLTPAEFVETIGIVALANAICRLDPAVELVPPSA